MMVRALVSGVGGDVAQGVIRCLSNSELDIHTYKISSTLDDSWLYIDDNSFLCPHVEEERYVTFLIDFIKEHEIDIFFPCIDSEILAISLNKQRIENETSATVFVDNIEKIRVCDDKLLTARFLEENGFKFPKTVSLTSYKEIEFPLIVKQRTGCGSREVYLVNSDKELETFEENDNYILQEYLEDPEYTAGLYLGDDGEVKGRCIFKRQLRNGSTYTAERINNPFYEEALTAIAKSIGLKYTNIQFRLKDGEVCPFEINSRFSGTTGIIGRVFNAPEMAIKEKVLNRKINKVVNREKFYVMRYYEEIYATEQQRKDILKRSKCFD
jgi:carbamoyl-phosphate synthase large subunit